MSEPRVIEAFGVMCEMASALGIKPLNQHEGCWRMNDGVVIIIDSGGDVTPVPMQAFKRDQAV